MKALRILALVALVTSTPAFDAARATEHPKHTEQPAKAEQPTGAHDLVAVAGGTANLTTFVAAIKAAGLVDKLQGMGPYTVFAPTDEAFAKLPDGLMESLLQPASQAKLAGILANHVVPGVIMATQIKTMKAANVNGQDLELKVEDGAVTANGAMVVQADLVADNGVIHAVDQVIMPAAASEHPATDKPKDHPAH